MNSPSIIKAFSTLFHRNVAQHLTLSQNIIEGVPLSVIADVCRITKLRVINVSGITRYTFVLGDEAGFPKMRLVTNGDNYWVSFTNGNDIKERGSNRSALSTSNTKYLLTAIRKLVKNGNYSLHTTMLPKLASTVAAAVHHSIASVESTKYASSYVSLTLEAFHALMDAVTNGVTDPLSTLNGVMRSDVDCTFATAKNAMANRKGMETMYQDNFYTKTFYAIYDMNSYGTRNGIAVGKFRVNPAHKNIAGFNGGTDGNRVLQDGAVITYPTVEAMLTSLPDLEFQLTMMQQARAHDTDITRKDSGDVLSEEPNSKYYPELNIVRYQGGAQYGLPIGQLTMVEAV